jgi:hypothetical protein
MLIIGKTATTIALLGAVTRVGDAQAAPAASTQQAPSVETVYKQLGLVAHPAKGQTQDQQKVDARECFDVAKGQSGFDPLAAPTADPAAATAAATQQTADATQGAAVVGGAKGAAGGALIGAVAGDAGKGAAIGAATGAVVGRSRKKRAEKQAGAQAASATASVSSQQVDAFKKAAGACLQGRGYTLAK